MNSSASYSIIPLAGGVWSIEMEMVRAFVVAGDTSAVLIDTGAGGVDLRQAVLQLTNLPVSIVNTHSHFDHISGNNAFPAIFAHPMEIASIGKAGYTARPLNDGFGFTLGGRVLQAVSLPGHSPGSIALWDFENGLLFAGDTVACGRPVFLSLEGASVEAYARSLDRLLALPQSDVHDGRLERIFCSHGEAECSLDTVRALKALADRVLEGSVTLEMPTGPMASSLSPTARIVHGDHGVSLLLNAQQ